MVVALAEFGRLLVVGARADFDQFQRKHVVALVVAVFAGGAGGDRRVEQAVDRLALLFHVVGERSHVLGHEQLIGPQAGVAEAGIDESPVDRSEDTRFENAAVDRLVDLLLEVADVLGALVLDADEANPPGRGRQRFGALLIRNLLHGLIDVPGEEFGDGIVHERSERLLPGLVAADHGVFAWHHHAGKLHAAAAGGGEHGNRQRREAAAEKTASFQLGWWMRSVGGSHLPAPFRAMAVRRIPSALAANEIEKVPATKFGRLRKESLADCPNLVAGTFFGARAGASRA